MFTRLIVLDEELERVVRDGNSQKHEVDRLEWPDLRKFLVCLVNFRRGGASRSFEAMVWISEISSAKSIAELKTSKNHHWSNFEVLDSEIASGFKTPINWDSEIGVAIDEQCLQIENALSQGQTGRMDDLHEFEGQRHRSVCFGRQWDCQRRIGKWQRPVVQHALGRNHHRHGEKPIEKLGNL